VKIVKEVMPPKEEPIVELPEAKDEIEKVRREVAKIPRFRLKDGKRVEIPICIYCMFLELMGTFPNIRPTNHSIEECGAPHDDFAYDFALKYIARYISVRELDVVNDSLDRTKEVRKLKLLNIQMIADVKSDYAAGHGGRTLKDVVDQCKTASDKLFAIQEAFPYLDKIEHSYNTFGCDTCAIYALYDENFDKKIDLELYAFGEHTREHHRDGSWRKMSVNKSPLLELEYCSECNAEFDLQCMYSDYCKHTMREKYAIQQANRAPIAQSQASTRPKQSKAPLQIPALPIQPAIPGCWKNSQKVSELRHHNTPDVTDVKAVVLTPDVTEANAFVSQAMEDVVLCTEIGTLTVDSSECVDCLVYNCYNRETHPVGDFDLCINCMNGDRDKRTKHSTESCMYSRTCLVCKPSGDILYWRHRKGTPCRSKPFCELCKSQGRPYGNHGIDSCGYNRRQSTAQSVKNQPTMTTPAVKNQPVIATPPAVNYWTSVATQGAVKNQPPPPPQLSYIPHAIAPSLDVNNQVPPAPQLVCIPHAIAPSLDVNIKPTAVQPRTVKFCKSCYSYNVKYDNHDTIDCALAVCNVCGGRHSKFGRCTKFCQKCLKKGKRNVPPHTVENCCY
jgi:hypothetical protein